MYFSLIKRTFYTAYSALVWTLLKPFKKCLLRGLNCKIFHCEEGNRRRSVKFLNGNFRKSFLISCKKIGAKEEEFLNIKKREKGEKVDQEIEEELLIASSTVIQLTSFRLFPSILSSFFLSDDDNFFPYFRPKERASIWINIEKCCKSKNKLQFWAVVVAQKAVRSLPAPVVQGSNPAIFIMNNYLLYGKVEN